MKELKPKTSSDITGLSNKLLKHIGLYNLRNNKPLTIIINHCMNTEIFLFDLKVENSEKGDQIIN